MDVKVVFLIIFFAVFCTHSQDKYKAEKEKQVGIKQKISSQKQKEKELIKKIKGLKKSKTKKKKKVFSTSYKRISAENNLFWAEPAWIPDNKQVKFFINHQALKLKTSSQTLKINITEMETKSNQNVFLKLNNSGIYEGTFDFKNFKGNDFYIFFTFMKSHKERTVFFKLAPTRTLFEKDKEEVLKANKILSIVIAVREALEKRRVEEESTRIEREMEELRKAKAEKIALEKKLRDERELLQRKQLEDERIRKLKEAEKRRQLYEQRLAEERRRKLEAQKARILAERKRKLELMKRKKAASIKKAKQLVAKGQEEIINGEYLKAIKYFNTAKKYNPLNSDADFYKGVAFFYLDKRQESLEILLKIEEEDPSYKEVHYYLASLYFKEKKYGAAVVKFKDAIKLNIKANESKMFLAMSYFKMEEYEKSLLGFIGIAGTKQNRNARAYLFVGLSYFNLKQYDKAIKVFEELYYESDDFSVADKAEAFLRKARALKKFEERKSKWFELSATLGYLQNSNVSSAAENDPTNSGKSSSGYSLDGTFAYLPFYSKYWDSSLSANYSMTKYSNADVKEYNSASFGAAAMLKYKSIYKIADPKNPKKSKNYIYSFTTTYNFSQLNMDGDPYSRTHTITPSLMVVLSNNHIGTLSLPVGMEYYQETVGIGENSKDAKIYSLSYSHLYFFTDEKDKNITLSPSYKINAAKGANEKFSQLSLSSAYSQDIYWNVRGSLGLSYSSKSYSSREPETRSDKLLTFAFDLSRDLYKDLLSGSIYFNYNKNSSNEDEYTYKSWIMGLNLITTYW